MYISSGLKCFQKPRFTAQRRDDSELDLRVIGREQEVLFVARHKGFANLLTPVGANWNILQIRILGVQPSRCSHYLVEGGVNTMGLGPNRGGQSVRISGFELSGCAVVQ